jgi:hypothetical protein
MAWAIKWRSKNEIDGEREFLLGIYYSVPKPEFMGCPKLLFRTRKAAREFIADKFGYIRKRPDLKAEPHGYKMPIPVKVSVEITEV